MGIDFDLDFGDGKTSPETEYISPDQIFASLAPVCEVRNKAGKVVTASTVGVVTIGEATFNIPVALFSNYVLTSLLNDKDSPLAKEDAVIKNWWLQGSALPECKVGNESYPYFAMCHSSEPKGRAELVLIPGETPDKKLAILQQTLGRAFTDFLDEVSGLFGGLVIKLHVAPLSTFHSPFKDKDGILHIFLGATPIGPGYYGHPAKLFGQNVDVGGKLQACFEPSVGRGMVLSDGETDIVQICGNNIYLLFNPFTFAGLGHEFILRIFEQTIALAINWWVLRDENDFFMIKEEVPLSINDAASEWFKEMSRVNVDYIARLQENIAKLQHELREKMRTLAQQKRTYDILFRSDVGFEASITTALVSDYAKIVAHPMVERSIITPKLGFDVYTKTIEIPHSGKRHRIGKFVIRFGLDGVLFIWAEESFHPDGVPHPHITLHNGPCFGNVGNAISEAIAEYRYYDALCYIITWLTDGYMPELIIYNKVEEWPIVDDDDNTQELVDGMSNRQTESEATP